MKLYHYVHCPFCIRVRMASGLLNIPYDSIVLPYDDENTPILLSKVKMLPIMEFQDGTINESLDIITKLDSSNLIDTVKVTKEISEIDYWTNEIGKSVHSMAMPYWIWTPEFNNTSRSYFQNKKEIKRGPFSELVKKQNQFAKDLEKVLVRLEEKLTPYYNSDKITLRDIILASHLWGMYVVPEFQFSSKIHSYLQNVKSECNFNYHEDFWR